MPTGSSNKWSARVLPRLCCFSKQEQTEASKADDKGEEDLRNSLLLSKRTAIVFLSHLNNGSQNGDGMGIIVKNNLVLTSHGTIPSVDSAKGGEMTINHPAVRGGCCPTPTTLKQKLLPRKFFFTSRARDMTVVACEDVSPVVPLNLDLSSFKAEPAEPESEVYLLGAHRRGAKSLKSGVARVAANNGSIVEFSAGTETWLPGSAGFDSKGGLVFMVCEPKRYICQPDGRGTSSPVTVPKQAGVLVHEVTSWLYDHLPAGNDDDQGATSAPLDEVKKPVPRRPSSAPAAAASTFCLKKHRHLNYKEFENEDTEDEVEAKVRLHMASTPQPVASATSSSLQSPQSPCSPRSTLKLRDPTISLSPNSIATPTRCLSPNPRLPGVSYSVSPSSRSLRSARSRRSSPRSSRHSKRSPSCVGGTRYEDEDSTLQQKFHQFLNSPEYEPPLCPTDMPSSDDDTPRQQTSASRGRSRSAADTKKHIFGGPVRRTASSSRGGDDSGASDAEVYMGVGYLKHTQVSMGKASKKKGIPGYTVWHH